MRGERLSGKKRRALEYAYVAYAKARAITVKRAAVGSLSSGRKSFAAARRSLFYLITRPPRACARCVIRPLSRSARASIGRRYYKALLPTLPPAPPPPVQPANAAHGDATNATDATKELDPGSWRARLGTSSLGRRLRYPT
jgi:hypothetical protein